MPSLPRSGLPRREVTRILYDALIPAHIEEKALEQDELGAHEGPRSLLQEAWVLASGAGTRKCSLWRFNIEGQDAWIKNPL